MGSLLLYPPLSLLGQAPAPAPVPKVWFCRLVWMVTVAGLPLGSTDTVKSTFGPLADVVMFRFFNGPYVVTPVEAGLSQGLPAPAPPWLPLQSCTLSVTFCPLGNPLTVWVTPDCPPVGKDHVPQPPPPHVQVTVDEAPCEGGASKRSVACPSVPVGVADTLVTGPGVAVASICAPALAGEVWPTALVAVSV